MSFGAGATVIFDTDVLIWAERGSEKAMRLIGDAEEKAISIYTYMELMQGVRSSSELRALKEFIYEGCFQVFPLTENVGHRALIYVEAHATSSGLRASDAIIAATAIEHNFMLVSGNQKHFKVIPELQFKHFKPS